MQFSLSSTRFAGAIWSTVAIKQTRHLHSNHTAPWTAMRHSFSTLTTQLREMESGKERRESENSPRSGSSSERADEQTPNKRRRHRRGKHRRRWKPYSKMTPEERQQAESREAARAAKRERDMMGKPAAPWNTTQFIMEEHECGEMNLSTSSISRTISVGSISASDEEADESWEESGVESGVFWNRDYETVVAEMEEESLRGLTHTELVQQCLQLKEENRRLREENSTLTQTTTTTCTAVPTE